MGRVGPLVGCATGDPVGEATGSVTAALEADPELLHVAVVLVILVVVTERDVVSEAKTSDDIDDDVMSGWTSAEWEAVEGAMVGRDRDVSAGPMPGDGDLGKAVGFESECAETVDRPKASTATKMNGLVWRFRGTATPNPARGSTNGRVAAHPRAPLSVIAARNSLEQCRTSPANLVLFRGLPTQGSNEGGVRSRGNAGQRSERVLSAVRMQACPP